MSQEQKKPTGGVTVQVHSDSGLPTVTLKEFNEKGAKLLLAARRGFQFAVINDDGKIIEVVGMNGHRVLPDPPEDFSDDADEAQPDWTPPQSRWVK